jgi:4-hydroxymandelate oxidase
MIVAEPWPLNVFDVERWALAKLPRDAADYFAGGAEDEVTLRANRAALEAVTLRPRVLVDVGALDTRVTVLGTEAAFPVLVAPTGFQQLAHLEGERAMARGTAAAGTVMVVSTYATVDLEQVQRAGDGPKWFQLYVHRDRGLTRSLVERATEAGYRALVVTADVPVLGRRERDLRNQFLLPTNMRAANFPALDSMELHDAAARESALEHFHAGIREPSFTWKDLDWLASLTSLPLVLKGVLRGDDTRRALDRGVRGLIVSNHGGRQLDGAVPTIRALPEVVAAVDGAAEVLMDGGIRRGVDVVRALALGARAVLIGRPAVYGLAWNGARGVQAVLELLRTELETAMALCGAPSVSEVTRDLVEGGGQSAKR